MSFLPDRSCPERSAPEKYTVGSQSRPVRYTAPSGVSAAVDVVIGVPEAIEKVLDPHIWSRTDPEGSMKPTT